MFLCNLFEGIPPPILMTEILLHSLKKDVTFRSELPYTVVPQKTMLICSIEIAVQRKHHLAKSISPLEFTEIHLMHSNGKNSHCCAKITHKEAILQSRRSAVKIIVLRSISPEEKNRPAKIAHRKHCFAKRNSDRKNSSSCGFIVLRGHHLAGRHCRMLA